MNLVKTCPACNHQSSPQDFFCPACGTDISQVVPAAPFTTHAPAQATPSVASATAQAGNAQKICPACQTPNDDFVILCRSCGFDFSIAQAGMAATPATAPTPQAPIAQTPAPQVAAQAPVPEGPSDATALIEQIRQQGGDPNPGVQLILVSGPHAHGCKHGDVLGRESSVGREIFQSIPTVHRHHLIVQCKSNQWTVMPLPGTKNISQIDGSDMNPGIEYPLSGDHLIKLSTRCEVMLRVI